MRRIALVVVLIGLNACTRSGSPTPSKNPGVEAIPKAAVVFETEVGPEPSTIALSAFSTSRGA